MKQPHWRGILASSVCSLVLGFVFLRGGTAVFPNVGIMACLGFIMIGLIGVTTALSIRAISKRLDDLEARFPEEPAAELTEEEQERVREAIRKIRSEK